MRSNESALRYYKEPPPTPMQKYSALRQLFGKGGGAGLNMKIFRTWESRLRKVGDDNALWLSEGRLGAPPPPSGEAVNPEFTPANQNLSYVGTHQRASPICSSSNPDYSWQPMSFPDKWKVTGSINGVVEGGGDTKICYRLFKTIKPSHWKFLCASMQGKRNGTQIADNESSSVSKFTLLGQVLTSQTPTGGTGYWHI